jgi:hypothetical protein
MQIKTTMKCHVTTVRMAGIKRQITSAAVAAEKEELLYTVGRNVN